MLCLVVFKGRRTENLKLKLELVKIKYEMITVRNIVNEKYTFPIYLYLYLLQKANTFATYNGKE